MRIFALCFKFEWYLFPNIQLTVCQHWFRQWWRHQMEPFSALLALCAGNSPVTGEFPTHRPAMQSFDVFFDLRLNKRLSKQSWVWWFETPPRLWWRHCNVVLGAEQATSIICTNDGLVYWRICTSLGLDELTQGDNIKLTRWSCSICYW